MNPNAFSTSLLLLLCSAGATAQQTALQARPLPERSATSGTRFRKLNPARTGLQFQNLLYRENTIAYVYSGAGVAVGDYDGDGRPDIYLVSQDGPNKLFRQTGPWQFTDVTAAAGGLDGGEAWGTAATFVDLNGDGHLDLYVCNLESPNLLYLNRGDGTFREAAAEFGLDFVGACMGAAFADYDNDGDLDLYLLNNRVFGALLPPEIVAEARLPKAIKKSRRELFPPYPDFPIVDGKKTVPPGYEDFFAIVEDRVFIAGQRDRLFRNDGNGKWRDVSDAAGIRDQGNGLSVVWWDADDDGWLDLYVANDFQSPDLFYRNRGDGSFEEISRQALPHTAFFGMGCDYGDIDNDGRLDLCVADMSSTSHYMGKMLMGNMNTHRWFLMNANPPQYMRNAVYLNTGTGRFLEAAYLANLASTDWTWTVRFADLDEDGRLDFYATNGIPVFTDDPDAARRFDALWQQGRKQQALDLFRHLRRIDEKNIARRNLGDLRFADVSAEWGLDEAAVSHGAVFADLDGDGDLDLIVNNQNSPASLYENTTSDAHRILVELRAAAPGNRQGLGSRITLSAGGLLQTRLLTSTRGYMSAGPLVEHFGFGSTTTIDWLKVRWPSGREQTWTGLATDHHYLLTEDPAASPAAASASPPPLFRPATQLPTNPHVEADFDDFALQPLLPQRLSRLGPGLAFADFDGDGRLDYWRGGAAGAPGELWQQQPGGSYRLVAGPWAAEAACEDLGAVWLDYDGDGDLDLYVVSGGIEAGAQTELLRDRIYRNDGNGRFAKDTEALPDLRRSGSCVCAADFDGDGDLDLFVGSRVEPGRFPFAPTSTLLRNDGGRFVEVTAELAPDLLQAGMVSAAVWADLDGDAQPELLVAAQWQPLRILRRRPDGTFRDQATELGFGDVRGQWNGIAVADFTGEGRPAVITTNLGLNTKYKASPEQPQWLFAKDFDGNGVIDIIEGKRAGDLLLPVRGLSCSSDAIPSLARRFPTYDAFARATLGQIYGVNELEQSLQLSCNELQHLLWVPTADGRYTAQPLPRLAQISAASGIAIADFDGDGQFDIVLAQNSFAPEPETGRIDGGLSILLRGLGEHRFAAEPALRSGIVLPDDSKAVCVVDLDGNGSPDLCIATNAGPLRGLLNQHRKDDRMLQLHGGPGNPEAIGAQVVLVRGDGRREVHQVFAGSGYLSHAAGIFLRAVDAFCRVEVRWPDGKLTQHEPPVSGARWDLRR